MCEIKSIENGGDRNIVFSIPNDLKYLTIKEVHKNLLVQSFKLITDQNIKFIFTDSGALTLAN